MVKSRALVEKKMVERIRTAGAFLRDAMTEAPDPIDVLLKDPETFSKLLSDAVAEAVRRGSFKAGLEKAKKRDAWRSAIDRAGAHYEERATDITAHALEDYDKRKDCIEKAKKAIEAMPSTTRAQRIARSAKYQEEVAKCFDALYGRKG